MDEFPDEEDLVAFNSKPLPSQIFQDDDDEEEELEALREMEQETQKENRFKKSLSFSKEPVLKRPRPPMSSSDDSNANKSLPLTDLPEDLDVFKLNLAAPPRKKRQIEPEKEKGADPGPPFVGTENSVTEPQKIHKRIPRGDFQAVTLPEGDRFYLEVREKSQLSDWKHHSSTDGQFGTGLCGMPFALLKEEAEKIKIASEKNIEVLKDFERLNEALMMDAAEENKENENADAPLSTLWVEKFKPRSYLQLLSDDGTNRVLLQWLKYWDKVVFDKEIRVKKRNLTVKEEWKKFPGKGEKKDKGGGGAATAAASLPSKEENEEDQLDEHDRPKMKVALLHGPPGLGKTTLAHVIAKHAGYNVVEMNASDDRTLQAFKVKIEAATQMRSVISREKKPNCLVIDEIDGAPAATINHLINVISGKAGGKSKKKGGGGGDLLQRPIICICNDLFVPALRNLRPLAMVVPFPPTESARLATRLKDIAFEERLETDLTALMALCEKTDNDIRACLSTLQFFKSKGIRLRLMDVQNSNVGQKDSQKTHFAVWKEMFSISRSSKKKLIQVGGVSKIIEESAAALPVRFKSILHTVCSCGEYDRLMQGTFENYLNVQFKDSQLENVIYGHDWFLFFDLGNQHILQSQIYNVMAYLPYTFVASHLKFASLHRTHIKYPSTPAEKRAQQEKSSNLIQSMISDMSPKARVFASPTALTFDLLPHLLEIIQPNLRPVNTQLYSAREKAELKNLVDTMIGYNLAYVQERMPDGQYTYKLEPNVEDLSNFAGVMKRNRRAPLSYATKQLVAHEIQIQKMRGQDDRPGDKEQLLSTKTPTMTTADEKEKAEEGGKTSASASGSNIPRHLQKLQAKELNVKASADLSRDPVDFFGRAIAPEVVAKKLKEDAANDKNSEIVSSDIWFKFKEGYNNAVRRNVKMKDLM